MLRDVYGLGFHVRSGGTLQFPFSQPIPDIVVLQGSWRDYKGRFPRADEIALVVEVSNATIYLDLHEKVTMYARNGILEYWVVDVDGRAIERYRPDAVEVERLTQTLRWKPSQATPALSIDLDDYFRRVRDE